MEIKVCFLGGSRYDHPLNPTSEKKFRALKRLGDFFVIGFSRKLCPYKFTEHAHFYLLPLLPFSVLRYTEIFVTGLLLTCYLISRRGVQVLIAQSPYEGFAAAWAKMLAGWFGHRIVLIVESHSDFEESLFMQRRIPLPRLYRFLMRRIAEFTLGQADMLRAVSDSTRKQLKEWILGRPIVQFPAWTDIEVFLHTGRNRKKSLYQNVLFAGVLIPLKGVHYLINAFARIAEDFSSAQLILVGYEANSDYAVELKNQVKLYGLSERVQFVGAIPQADLAERMGKACVLVLPSISEGLGRVVIEAMAAGIPVIGSDVGGIPEMVEEGTTGFLVPAGDEVLLTERLRWVLEHPDEVREMGHRARVSAERFFSTEAYVKGYQKIVETAHVLLNDGIA